MEKLLQELRSTGGIFNVRFYKKDGSRRSINARFGVRKGISGAGLKYDPASRNNIIVYSMVDDGFRTINLDSIYRIKFNGQEYIL
jgi:hypothetical protein